MAETADKPYEGLVEELALPRIQAPVKRSFHCARVRDLVQADMAALELPRGAKPKALQRIHSSHHALAKCLAAGMRPNQASLVTGYSTNRISSLQADDAFKALVAEYQGELKDQMANLAERMMNVSLDALEMLHEKLHEKPEDFGVGALLDIVKTFADRTGFGPNQQVNLNVVTGTIDRPPRESYDEWQKRRQREIESDADSVGSSTWPADGRDHRRLVS